MGRKVLVVGSRRGGMGYLIQKELEALGLTVVTADVEAVVQAGHAQHNLDVTNRASVVQCVKEVNPTDIVCTAGINLPDGEPGTLIRNMAEQFQVNAWGPLMLFAEAMDHWSLLMPGKTGFTFSALSSNSAHIARSNSAGYCASKAALSAGLRSMARRFANGPVTAWCYEPGWISGTTMSQDVLGRLAPGMEAHRIPGGRALDADALAYRIARDVYVADRFMNGTCIRIDGGEQ